MLKQVAFSYAQLETATKLLHWTVELKKKKKKKRFLHHFSIWCGFISINVTRLGLYLKIFNWLNMLSS